MQIGIDISCIPAGRGPARYTIELIKAIAKDSKNTDEFILFSHCKATIDTLPDNFVFKIVPQQKWRPWLNWTLPIAARRDKLDVMFFPANDCWLWKAIPTVVALLDVAQFTTLYNHLPSWKDRLQIRLQMNRIGKVADKIITISEFSRKEIYKIAPGSKNKTEVVYCGLSEPFLNNSVTKKSVKEPYILFVGGFDRRKNLERLLQAYKILLKKGHQEKLLLIGSSGDNMKLYYDMPALIHKYNLETMVEIKKGVPDDELVEYFANASVFVLPSIVEGFGFPVIEAQACGCPVVCSNAASLPEVGGDAAVYFDPSDVAAMAESIGRVLKDEPLAKKLRENGTVNCRRFSWSKAGEQVYTVLRSVLNKKK